MSKKRMAIVFFSCVCFILVLFVFILNKYLSGYINKDNNYTLLQQQYQIEHRDKFKKLTRVILENIKNDSFIKSIVDNIEATPVFPESSSKGRVGWINEHFNIANLVGTNELFFTISAVSSKDSPHFKNPAKLSIGNPSLNNLIFIKGNRIFTLNELQQITKLSGLIMIIFTENYIYHFNFDLAKGGYYIRLSQ